MFNSKEPLTDCTDSQRNTRTSTRTQRLAQDDSCRHTPGCQQGHRLHLKDPFSLVFLGSGSYTQHSIMHVYTRLRRSSLFNAPRALLTDTPAASTLSEYVFPACHRTTQHKTPAMHHHRPSIQPSPSIVRHSPRSSLLDHAHIQHTITQLYSYSTFTDESTAIVVTGGGVL